MSEGGGGGGEESEPLARQQDAWDPVLTVTSCDSDGAWGFITLAHPQPHLPS